MELKTYTLWHGHLPLIHQTSKYENDASLYRVASSTMTQGAYPAHIKSKKHAEKLAAIHAVDGEKLDIQAHRIDL